MNEITLRILIFLGLFLLFFVLEIIAPKRALTSSKKKRWTNNLAILVVNSLVLRVLFPSATVGFAILASNNQWGLLNLNLFSAVPLWMKCVIAIVFLDFVIWLQHFLFHRIPILWRVHRVHHADVDIDLSTGLRFHPLEIVLSMLIKAAAIFLIGIPALSALIFEVVLNATSMFNHSNIRLTQKLDNKLRILVVTPDMHRVHHSWLKPETNSNFGFNLPVWDKLFGTYTAQPAAGHNKMTIGLTQFRSDKDNRFDQLLIQPFLKEQKEHRQ